MNEMTVDQAAAICPPELQGLMTRVRTLVTVTNLAFTEDLEPTAAIAAIRIVIRQLYREEAADRARDGAQ